jgi:tetratricopeptide (TPR) repeat protein
MTDPNKAVFLSYASQDAEAAKRICDALRAAGIEVWFDQSELRGGDAWDASIRRQIKTCALFIALISASTRARTEGYFRLEWKLAIDRSHLMATERAFLLPVVIDDGGDSDTTVPDRFREVQWTRLDGGAPTKALVERVSRLLAAGNEATGERAPIAATPGASSPSPNRPATMSSAWRYSLAAATLILLVGGAWFIRHRAIAPPPIVPYSAEDRRMTFALLPLQAAAGDVTGEQIATATGEETYRSLDENHQWVQLVPAASVTLALSQFAAPRDITKALSVHYLMRGNVDRAASGYTVTLFMVEGETAHVLGTEGLSIPTQSLVPRWDDEIDHATGKLVFYALQSEVERARGKPDSALDVRDLAFRAFVDWAQYRRSNDSKGAYVAATSLLRRALALAPDDPLALRLTAQINLCDCIDAWSPNVDEQRAIAETAIERYLTVHPNDPGMLREKAGLYESRGRFKESLVVLDSVLRLDPENTYAMADEALSLLRLGRPKEAKSFATTALEHRPDSYERAALLAAIDFELGDYSEAERLAQQATTKMSKAVLSNPNAGTVRLTLIAAAARLHDETIKKSALADLADSVPALTSLGAIRKWMSPQAGLYGYEPLFDSLRLAGIPE